ncbi:MAG: cupin domain-containing protein [Caulobacteraceae bacterium]
MRHITNPENGPWTSFQIEGSRGFNFVFDALAAEYTDAYSIDLVKVDVGGFSPYHIDPDNHAFYIVDGEAQMVIADLEYTVRKGEVARIPKGVVHSIANSGTTPLLMLAVYDPPRDRSVQKARAAAQAVTRRENA